MEEKHAKRWGRGTKIGGIMLAIFFVLMFGGAIFLELQSPAYIYVNNTDKHAKGYVIGATSPGHILDLEPGEKDWLDMPSWWGKPEDPRNDAGDRVMPKYDFGVLKVFYLSEFSEEWFTE